LLRKSDSSVGRKPNLPIQFRPYFNLLVKKELLSLERPSNDSEAAIAQNHEKCRSRSPVSSRIEFQTQPASNLIA